ncbi:MAG: bifunctional methylenetetrahydrofolate dehydrogenase/methenyltetrahydrofolate cyclohydrolase FolD [Planctomycetes bacterium]|nr:bifunctional methylenetetrahydrofolate dehydrogenase/methenyltetrahydrofolate cyclohydrolase FolD [Planctomycetota bacterium]
MTAKILDGKQLAQKTREALAARLRAAAERGAPRPGLATMLVGDDPASHVYVRNKRKACEEVGIRSFHLELPASARQDEVLAAIARFNADPQVHGILLQLPLPKGLDAEPCLRAIAPEKDVDGFHPWNVGQLFRGERCFVPCTPAGVMRLLDHAGVDPRGKNALVVGRSQIVGLPVSRLLLGRDATVTIAHSRSRDLAELVGRAEILVAAVGRAEMIRGEWIRPGAVVIDVGINRVEKDGATKLVGDVEFAGACERAAAITPVPGGVGPMTIAMLLENTAQAAGL